MYVPGWTGPIYIIAHEHREGEVLQASIHCTFPFPLLLLPSQYSIDTKRRDFLNFSCFCSELTFLFSYHPRILRLHLKSDHSLASRFLGIWLTVAVWTGRLILFYAQHNLLLSDHEIQILVVTTFHLFSNFNRPWDMRGTNSFSARNSESGYRVGGTRSLWNVGYRERRHHLRTASLTIR